MPFLTPDAPPADPAEFLTRPRQERIHFLATFWAEYGFGTPKMVHTIYIVKLLVLSIGGGIALATLTSDVGGMFDVGSWWDEPVIYQKVVLWTLFLELFGIGGTWGPLAAHFKPMTGGIAYWARPDTIRLPPWPGKVPFTAGDNRSVFDVLLYLTTLASFLVAVVAGSSTTIDGLGGIEMVDPVLMAVAAGLLVLCGLRDKTLFLAARGEQYLPILLISALAGSVLTYTDFIIAAKLIIVIVWVGASISKINPHFENVVPPMVSNAPFTPKFLKRAHYRSIPDDLKPSRLAWFMAHVLGTTAELAVPLVLLFSTNWTITLLAVGSMVLFHLFITQTFPLAVPLEWNIVFAYIAIFLFAGHFAGDGYTIADFSEGWMLPAIVAVLVFFPVLGNLRPDLVSFLPSMRQYAGNWASATWAFKPGAEAKLNQLTKPAKNQIDQLVEGMGYDPAVAEMTMQMTLAWRSMHSQGRGLFSVMQNYLGDEYENYSLREAEFCCNSIIGWNFGDGHLHDDQLIEAIQKRVGFEPGEFVVVWVESQPIHKKTQAYFVMDAALGIVERGTWLVSDCVKAQPWLPDGPVPVDVTYRNAAHHPQLAQPPRANA
ncbi:MULTISPECIES: DUF3556 domain-containing protein [unclassified Nocardioides]|uniref:DUF3556 domain-containing protein n=1 Tax=unclassified Nocardioides TaxID=2615069 RepID=UPI0006F44FA5|nr:MULTISPECIES: DUF3556 domain-containing protein [unclassified Nocardioides]KRA37596.1 hypothetical protein ASD81_02500 [Nocardioides sp. Root614]KRA91557.1 hypothetical protein ASD84_02765 [Nocardioides sp. Root682]